MWNCCTPAASATTQVSMASQSRQEVPATSLLDLLYLGALQAVYLILVSVKYILKNKGVEFVSDAF